MNNIILYGNLNLSKKMVVCGHPGLCCDKYYYDVEDGLYDIYVREVDNTKNKPNAVEIQVLKHHEQWSEIGDRIGGDISNDNHGGILIASKAKLDELGHGFEDSKNPKLWNYFANGLCLKRSYEYDGWKSNCSDGNIIFVPSCEYYRAFRTKSNNGIAILCDQEPDG